MVVISMRFDRMRSQRFVGSMFVQPMSSSKSGIFMRLFRFFCSFSSCLLPRSARMDLDNKGNHES